MNLGGRGTAMQRLAIALLLLGSLFVSGCTTDGLSGGDGSSDSANLEGIPEGQAPTGVAAGTASDHGQASRTETPVTVERAGSQWVAKQTVTYENDFGGASAATVKLSTDAGGVAARGWSSGGYKTVILLQARADSEADARAWLDRITVTHSDRLSGGRLSLATDVDLPDGDKPDRLSMSGGVTASLPKSPSYALEMDAAAGGASTQGLNGPSVDADVAAGGISVDGAFGRMVVAAAAGGVELLGTANDVTASADAGGIGARLRAGGSGGWAFDVDAGGLTLAIDRTAGDAFDVEGTVTAGGLSVDLSDGETLSSGGGYTGGSKHVRSRGFDTAAVQVTIDASVTAGGLDVHD